MRFYFTSPVLDNTGSWTCPIKLNQQNAGGSRSKFTDLRPHPEIEDGVFLAWSDNTDGEHAANIALAEVDYIPLVDGIGDQLPLTATVAEIDGIPAIKALFESVGVPTGNITAGTTIADAMRRVTGRARLRQVMGHTDFPNFTQIVSEIPAIKKKAMLKRLENHGYNVAGVSNEMTAKSVLELLINQNVAEEIF